MRKAAAIRLIASLAAAVVMTALATSGALFPFESILADSLYQKPRALSGDVVIVGIDAQSLEDIGPIQMWGRDIYAMAIEALNAEEENRPAVIGLDVIFAGDTDPDADVWLAEAAGQYGNVVVASAAEIGPAEMARDDGSLYMEQNAVLSYDAPYPALEAAADAGHINAMFDADGVLRHSLLGLDLPDGRHIPSFNRLVYQKYAAVHGLDPGRIPPLADGSWWYLPFSAEPGGFYDGVSISALIAGDVPADYFAGKAVLIGPYTVGLQDQVTTAIDHAAPMYGVEYQANAVEALISGDFRREIAKELQLVLLFAISFGCFLWFQDRRMIHALPVFVAVLGGYPLLCVLLSVQGYVLEVMWIPLSSAVSFVVCVSTSYIRARKEAQRVTDTFKRYVAPEIVSEILKGGPEALQLGGKLTEIAVLFVDIRGFTPMSEILEPTEVVDILNHYLELTSSCIIRNSGTLDKFVGDATMAIWGAPMPQEDYVMKAARAAMDMLEGSHKLGEELFARYGRTVSFGVGIHCGKAVVGNIGAPIRMDYTAIGDTVNTAARLESNAQGGQILISRAVANALGDRISTRSLGCSIKLKGKSDDFEILTLDGITENRTKDEAV